MTGRHFGRPAVTAAEQAHRQHPEAPGVPLPAAPGAPPYRLALAELGVPDPTDRLLLHTVGDTGGVKDPNPQLEVTKYMAGMPGVNLLYHLGDLVYFNGRDSEWFPQFYEPYDELSWPIVGIPGNHDGDNSDDPTVPSLTGFLRNMCAPAPVIGPDAKDAHRDTMTQPNVYWTLTAALATVVGLYTNVPSGGVVDATQAAWLEGELAAAPTDRALIVALHHPPYSVDNDHGGSATMGVVIDAAALAADRWPDLVLAGHVHNYQRFTRAVAATPKSSLGAKDITYIVAGAGGYHNLHALAPTGPLPFAVPGTNVTLEGADDNEYGFLELTITPGRIDGRYLTPTSGPKDVFTVPT